MKKILFVFALFSITYIAFSEQPNLIKSFSIGNSINELGVNTNPPPTYDYSLGPDVFGYSNNNFYIFDNWNNRIVIYDNSFNPIDEIQVEAHPLFGGFVKKQGYFLNYFLDEGIQCINMEGEVIFSFYIFDQMLATYPYPISRDPVKSFLYYNDYLFIYDGDGILSSIYNPSSIASENKERFLNTQETKQLFLDPVQNNIEGLTLDDRDRFFIDGHLETLSFDQFISWSEEINNGTTSEIENWFYGKNSSSNMRFLGNDIDENSYWLYSRRYIAVYNSNGILFRNIKLDSGYYKATPVIDNSGNIYFLNYNNVSVDILRLSRDW